MLYPKSVSYAKLKQSTEKHLRSGVVATTAFTKAVRRFFNRVDFLSAKRPVSGIQEAAFLVFLPFLTFLFIVCITSIADVSYSPGCNSESNFIDSLLFRTGRPSTCLSVPFLSDVPTIILSFTCPFALVAYRLLRRRIAWLIPAVVETGLVRDPDLKQELTSEVHKLESAVDLNVPIRIILFGVTSAMTTWLYSRNLFHGHLFTILAIERHGASDEPALRASWWANYHHHPLLAIICIFIGSVGVYYALRAGWLNVRLGSALITGRRSHPSNLAFEYVPRWKDKSYGWSPVTGALFLIYISTVNFAVSMVAVWDMLQNATWTVAVAAFFVVLGIVSDLLIILSSFIMMLSAHRAVEQRLRSSLIHGTQGGAVHNAAEYAVAASDLTNWRQIPVSSLSATALKVIPGIYAFVQFVVRAFFIKH